MSVSDSAAFIPASLSTASLRISRASVAPAPRTRAEQARPPLPSSRDRVWVPWVRRSVPRPQLPGVCAIGAGTPRGARGSPRGGRGRPGRRCGRALGCCLGAPRPQGARGAGSAGTPAPLRAGASSDPREPRGDSSPRVFLATGRRGALRGHRRLGCPEAGTPSRAGGGEPGSWSPGFAGGRGGPATSQFAGGGGRHTGLLCTPERAVGIGLR